MRRGSRIKSSGVNHPGQYNLRSAPKTQGVGDSHSGQVGTQASAMASDGRDDSDYLKDLEDELVKSRHAREEETKMLQSLLTRMDKMELQSSTATSIPVGRGILRTPLKATYQPTVGRRPSGNDLTSPLSSDLQGGGAGVMEPSPADMINGPLTSVLRQLSIAIDPTPQSSVKGLLLRPEYYIQHKDKGVPVKSLDHSKLSYKELISGMCRVMLHLSKTGGELSSYLEHFSFLSRKAGAHGFIDSAYVGYDRHVVDQFINGETDKFVSADLFAVALHFHAGNLVPAPTKPPVIRGFRGRGYRRGGRQPWNDGDRDKDRDKDYQNQNPTVEGFPEDLCYNYNYRSCHGKCAKAHVCRLCRGPHKASSGQCASKK